MKKVLKVKRFLQDSACCAIASVATLGNYYNKKIDYNITRSISGKKINKKLWYNFGWFTFIVGYAFTLNSIGIIISTITSIWIGVIFFASSITLSLSYTLFLVILEDKNPRERIVKDIFFIILLFGFGVIAIL